MSNPILEEIAKMIPRAEQQIADLKEMISVAAGADMDTSAQQAELKMLELKIDNWKRSLTEHGYKV